MLVNHFINGEFTAGQPGGTGQIFDPATGRVAGTVAFASATDVDTAVAAAHAAFPTWRATPPLRRARILDRFRGLLWSRKTELAQAISAEHGKTLADAEGEVTRGIEVVEFAAGVPTHLKGEYSENVGTGVDCHSIRQPLGVVAGITPFNFPAMVPMWMFPVAIACGNTFVLKPSERDPSASLLLAKWLSEAGLPAGVFNVIQGDRDAVHALLEHPQVRAVSFVGSTPVAEYIHREGTANRKRVQALGGAKNHAIVLPDADQDMTADALMGAAFGSAGERCMAISVAVAVGDGVADALVEKLVPRMRALRIGPYTDSDSDMGPLVTREHLQRVRDYIDRGEAEGATVVVDGRDFRQAMPGYEGGFFLGPTLIDRVEPDMSIWTDEIFGPVLALVRRSSFEQALSLVEQHSFANGTALFTRDGHSARRFSQEIDVGMVGINVPVPVPMAFHSFGGWKASLFGDHAMHGMEGVRFYTRLKTTTTRWPAEASSSPDFAMPTHG